MKKKHRTITVDNIKFGYTIQPNCDGDDGNMLNIWFNKQIIYSEILDYNIKITPKIITDIIKFYNENKNDK